MLLLPLQLLVEPLHRHGHAIEGHREVPHLVAGQHGRRGIEIAGGDLLRRLLDGEDRQGEAAREDEDPAREHEHEGQPGGDEKEGLHPRRVKGLLLADLDEKREVPGLDPAECAEHGNARIVEVAARATAALQRRVDAVRVDAPG